jgi:hypothetical protein
MLQVLETLHLMCRLIYFLHISLQILNGIYKQFKKEKFPIHFCLVYSTTNRFHTIMMNFQIC